MATETQTVASVQPSYRRNGKLFSCEPCRRGKLRCDHQSPICGRCARRNKPDQCIYHPAPLTKPRSSPGVQKAVPSPTTRPSLSSQRPSSTTPRSRSNGLATPLSNSAAGVRPHDLSAFRPVNSATLSHHPSAVGSPTSRPMATPSSTEDQRSSSAAPYASPTDGNMSFRDSKTGFLGATSYSAVFTENAHSLSVIAEPYEAEGASLRPLSDEQIQQGAEVLAVLREMPIYHRFTQRWLNLCIGTVVPQPILWVWIDELWSEFGRLLQESRPDQLRSLSELVWRNTRRPMKIHGQMTAIEFARAASGRNLRWEVVGLILSMVGIIAANLSNWDSVFDTIEDTLIDRATFAERMRKASEFCLCFCYESEVLNDIYVCFMLSDLFLVETLKGDAHYAAWQRTGEVCDAMVALGIHQGNPVNSETPFFLAEQRRSIFISVYSHDKIAATFLGRPPRLSHRYCKMELPLDLSDEQVCATGPELELALASLDENGWTRSGNFNRTTWRRVFFQHSRIREDILEVALGSGDEDISSRVAEIRRALDRLLANYPENVKIAPEELFHQLESHHGIATQPEKALRQINAISALFIQGGFAQTDFLLARAVVNRKRTDTKELIPISRRLLGLVLLANTKRDYFRDLQGDFVYLLANYGLPAAGVLAIELLKQEQNRLYTPEILPRSETIQDLSVFINALATVATGDGLYVVCDQGRRALKKIMDHILAPSHPPQGSLGAGVMGSEHGGQAGGFDDVSLYFPTANDADFLQWLENVEWDKPGVGWNPPGAGGHEAPQ